MVVQFYQRYDDAYAEYGSSGWGYVGTLGHDREVYLVSVHGHIGFCPRALNVDCPVYAEHSNGIYDATTGEGMGGGTAGTPLP